MTSGGRRLPQESGDSRTSSLPCSFYADPKAVVRDLAKKTERPAIHTPENQFKSAVDAAKLTLDSGLRTIMQIYDLGSLATGANGCIALNLLQWFVDEQIEAVFIAKTRMAAIRRANLRVLVVEAHKAPDGKQKSATGQTCSATIPDLVARRLRTCRSAAERIHHAGHFRDGALYWLRMRQTCCCSHRFGQRGRRAGSRPKCS